MKIRKIQLQNYRCLKGFHEFDISWNIIYLVWENNTWKTTLLSAIDFLKSWKVDNCKTKWINEDEETYVCIDFECNIDDISESKYHSYIFEQDSINTLRVKRSTNDVKKVEIFDTVNQEYKNITWVDKMIGSLFETQFVWSDMNPNDISDFWSTKICWKLISTITSDLETTTHRQNLVKQHKSVFHWNDSIFQQKKSQLESKIQQIFESQYWSSTIRFDFNLPEPSTFLKSWDIVINDWIETKLSEKWSWMQRAMALTLIQVYANHLILWETNNKPIFFFIDEPEISLHPKAQVQLLQALKSISENQQVFISTHSWFMLQQFEQDRENLFLFKKEDNNVIINSHNELNLFNRSPSWWEVMYRAFSIATVEFHNELYWSLQDKFNLWSAKSVDQYLTEKWVPRTKKWREIDPKTGQNKWDEYDCTLSQFIRHQIHHPENRKYDKFNNIELEESINTLIQKYID